MKKIYSIICPACKGKDQYCRICVGVGRVPRNMYMQVLQNTTKKFDEKNYKRFTRREELMIMSDEFSISELCERLHRSYRSIDSKRRKLKKERREKDEKESIDNANTVE